MLEDSLALRERIYQDLLDVTGGGTGHVARDWLLSYSIDGERLPLIDSQGRGIRNPAAWSNSLSITTVEKGKYPDQEIEPGVWNYPLAINKHGESDPSNVKYRNARLAGTPVIYFYKPVPHTYLLVGMVQVTAIDEGAAVSRIELLAGNMVASAVETELERLYVQRIVAARLHQPRFREIILAAYRDRCAVCALPDRMLLDAAHIRSDKDPANGQPVVENGLALCAIHHRAYDAKVIGIDADLGLHVAATTMSTADGPVLEHGIKSLNGSRLAVVPPRGSRPDPYRLELTYKEFLERALTAQAR
jgi:putative restriction endonuclease